MKKSLTVLFFLAFTFQAFAQRAVDVTKLLIPVPVSIQQTNGFFEMNGTTKVYADIKNKEVNHVVKFFTDKARKATGFQLPVIESVQKTHPGSFIRFALATDTALGNEGYRLTVTHNEINITAQKPAGLFYGVQSLFQLMPREVESVMPVLNVQWTIPTCKVMDKPRFGWRGLMLDVSRHFSTKDEVKQFIDEMVKYKYNVFHWHLTDDEGWRIEIKAYPKLTEIGAWAAKREGYFGTFPKPTPDEKFDYGGYYTQDDIREIVQYAKDRFVNVLPEVDVPGHSLAAVASYPELSCTADAVNYHVRSGEEIIDWSKGLPPIALIDNTLCPANENVYVFLDKVFTEIAALFPFAYIHVGGDECSKNFWEKSDAVKALMKKEGLKNMEEVQSYFVKRVGKIVESKGKKFIGWDEILEGGLAPGAAVMSWRGIDGGIQAAKMNHEVVMSPTTFAYLDYMQGDPAIESRVYATLRLQKAYEFDPLPPGVDPKFILGGQANLWTEQIYNYRYRQYMLWPRAMAIAEAVWSPLSKRNWNDFEARVEGQMARLDEANIKYAPSMYEAIINVAKDKDGLLQISLSTEVPGLDIHYSFDNSFPDQYYPKYKGPLTPVKGSVMLKIVSYRGNKQMGRIISVPLADLEKRVVNK